MGKSRKYDPEYEDDYGFLERKDEWRDERKEKRAKKEAIDADKTPPAWQPRLASSRDRR